MKLWFNLMCADIDAQFTFYRDMLKLPEATASRSPKCGSAGTRSGLRC